MLSQAKKCFHTTCFLSSHAKNLDKRDNVIVPTGETRVAEISNILMMLILSVAY